MSITNLTRSSSRAQAADDRSRLTRLLIELVSELTAVSNRAPLDDRSKPVLARWSDDETIYLEAELPEWNDLAADLCVHAGRVYVQIQRPLE